MATPNQNVEWVLSGLRKSVDLALKIAIVFGLAVTAQLIGPSPDLRWSIDGDLLFDETTGTADADVNEVVVAYNERVKSDDGTQTSELPGGFLHSIAPVPAQEETTAVSLLSQGVTEVVFYSGDLSSWARLDTTGLTQVDNAAWPNLEGCGDWIDVINSLYGPVACLVPSGALVPLAGSTGIPGYVRDLTQRITPALEDLRALLENLDRSFVIRALVTIRNDGDGDAKDVRMQAAGYIAVPGYTCPDTGVGVSHTFRLASGADSCTIALKSDTGRRSDIPRPSVTVTASNDSPTTNIRSWGKYAIVTAAALLILHLLAELYATWPTRSEQRGGG